MFPLLLGRDPVVYHITLGSRTHACTCVRAPRATCTQIVGQVKCHELVTKRRKLAQQGGKFDMTPDVGKAESSEGDSTGLCYMINHA